MTGARLHGPGVDVALELTPALHLALILLRADFKRNGEPWPAELEELAGVARSCADVYRQRQISGRKPADQPISDRTSQEPGSRRTLDSSEVGKVLGITGRRVRQLANAGCLPGVRGPSGWTFTQEDLDEYRGRKAS